MRGIPSWGKKARMSWKVESKEPSKRLWGKSPEPHHTLGLERYKSQVLGCLGSHPVCKRGPKQPS